MKSNYYRILSIPENLSMKGVITYLNNRKAGIIFGSSQNAVISAVAHI